VIISSVFNYLNNFKFKKGIPLASSPIFCALGDLHLDHLIWRAQRQVSGDAFLGLRSFLECARSRNLPAVYLGDIFDTQDPDSSLVQMFRTEADQFRQSGLAQYFIQGNHDKRPVPWCSAVAPYIQHVGDGVVHEIGGVKVVGYDYCHKPEIESHLAELSSRRPIPDVVFLHQAVRQVIPWDGAWNCDLDWVPDGVRLCLMGDIHQTREIKMRNGGAAWYTGSSHARSVDEMGPKYCLVVHDDLSVVPVPLDYRSMERFQATPTSPLEELLPRIHTFLGVAGDRPSSRLLKPLVWLSYTEDQAQGVKEVQKACHDRAILVEQPLCFRVSHEIPVTTSTDDVPTMQTLLGQLMDQHRDPAAYQLVEQLLDPTQDLQETLGAHRDRSTK
jgi:hypothetical protein